MINKNNPKKTYSIKLIDFEFKFKQILRFFNTTRIILNKKN